jgi:hypothetical protein
MKLFSIALILLAAAAPRGFGWVLQEKQAAAVPQSSADENAKKARAVIDQMIQALGGPLYLNLQGLSQQGRTSSFSHGSPNGSSTPFWRFVRFPDKERLELLKTREWVLIYTADEAYETTFRGTRPQETDAARDYFRRREYALDRVLRTWLNAPGTAFFYEGQAFKNNKQVEMVSILDSKNRGVTIAVDAATHLPVSKTFIARDPVSREKDEETEVYENFKTIDGIATPESVTRMHNGEIVNQRFIIKTTYNPTLNDDMFVPRDLAAKKK